MLGECIDIEAKPSQDRLQKRPNRPKVEDPTQVKHADKNKYKTQRSGSGRNTWDSHHHGLLVVRVAQPCCLGRTAVHPPLLPVCSFSSWLFGFLPVFVLKCWYLAT